jgi:hypothetical protein
MVVVHSLGAYQSTENEMNTQTVCGWNINRKLTSSTSEKTNENNQNPASIYNWCRQMEQPEHSNKSNKSIQS